MDDKSGHHSESERVESWTRGVKFALRQEPRPVAKTVGDANTREVQLKDWQNVRKSVRFLSRAKLREKPFLLYLGINLPHPYKTEENGPTAGGSTFKSSPYYLKQVRKNRIPYPRWLPFVKEHPVDQYAIMTKNCSGHWSKSEIKNIRHHYYGMLTEVDEMVGDVLSVIPRTQRDKTVIIFTSDHGDLAMEHRQYYKMSMYEGSVRVPMVISGPGFAKNATISSLVSLIDVYPTIMNAANIQTETVFDGVSLLQELPQDRAVVSVYHAEHMNSSAFMIRIEDIKLIYYADAEAQMFNLTEDPQELNSKIIPEQYQKLKKKLFSMVPVEQQTRRVKEYSRHSFLEWKESQGRLYEENISNLRWNIDFKKDREKNLQLIDQWLQEDGESFKIRLIKSVYDPK